MLAELLVTIALPALLMAAAAWDLASFTIPNFLTIALLAAFAVFALSVRMSIGGVDLHLLAGAAGLCIGFLLFTLGYIGGGDAKLFAGMAIWLGPKDLLAYCLIASLIGGGLSIVLLLLRRYPFPAILSNQGWLLKLHDPDSGVPYGVALTVGAFIMLPSTEIFRLAAHAS